MKPTAWIFKYKHYNFKKILRFMAKTRVDFKIKKTIFPASILA